MTLIFVTCAWTGLSATLGPGSRLERTCRPPWRGIGSVLLWATMSACAVTDPATDPANGGGDGDYGTLVDIDGNTYRTVRIGDQWWFAENLRTTRYADGTPIVDGTGDRAGSTDARFYHRHYEASSPLVLGGQVVVYNWAAVMRPTPGEDPDSGVVQGPAPEGWHVPSQQEWAKLSEWLSVAGQGGPGATVATKLLGLQSPSGFDALFVDAWFRGKFLSGPADQVNFWSTTAIEGKPIPHAYAPNLGARGGQFLGRNGANVLAGWSVRCVKDATEVS